MLTLRTAVSTELVCPRLAPGVEFLGPCQTADSQPGDYLYRRADGHAVQVSRILHLIVTSLDGAHSLDEVATEVSIQMGRRLSADGVAVVVDQKLVPLGLVAADGSPPPPGSALALRLHADVLSERAVNAAAGFLRPLFRPMAVVAVLVGVGVVDGLLVAGGHSPVVAARHVLLRPAALLIVAGLVVLAGTFHELGHATACRYSGGHPGRVGVGLYLVWPVFYSDVTDTYRLRREGRIRTDLGGIYLNLVFILGAGLGYLLSAWPPLLVLIALQHLVILQQFLPFVRLDGYYLLSDLVGVPDLFSYLKPILLSAIPGRYPQPAVARLGPRVRAVVTAWVVTTTLILVTALVLVIVRTPALASSTKQSLAIQLHSVLLGVHHTSPLTMSAALVQSLLLLLPITALTLTSVMAVWRVSSKLWRISSRRWPSTRRHDPGPPAIEGRHPVVIPGRRPGSDSPFPAR